MLSMPTNWVDIEPVLKSSNRYMIRLLIQINVFIVGKARIRVQISAAHTEADINSAVDAFVTIGRKLKVIK